MNNREGRIQPGLAIILAILAIGFLLVNSRGCFWSPDLALHNVGWFGAPWRFLTFTGLLQLILGVWVGVDAQKRGSNGYFWGLLVFFTSIIGLLVYLLWVTDAMEKIGKEVSQAKAQPQTAPTCPSCGGEVEDAFKACPACGTPLTCPGCDKSIRGGWNVCPWCMTKLETAPREG